MEKKFLNGILSNKANHVVVFNDRAFEFFYISSSFSFPRAWEWQCLEKVALLSHVVCTVEYDSKN